MITMSFSAFANILRPIIGGGGNTKVFARTLLDAITNDEGKGVLDSVTEGTYKGYYNGYVKLSDMASRLSPYLDEEEFVSFLNGYSDDVAIRLVQAFTPHIEKINKLNYATVLAAYFKEILMSAASQNSKENPEVEIDEVHEREDHTESDAVDTRADYASKGDVNQAVFINNGNGPQFQNNYAPITMVFGKGGEKE